MQTLWTPQFSPHNGDLDTDDSNASRFDAVNALSRPNEPSNSQPSKYLAITFIKVIYASKNDAYFKGSNKTLMGKVSTHSCPASLPEKDPTLQADFHGNHVLFTRVKSWYTKNCIEVQRFQNLRYSSERISNKNECKPT